MATVETTHFDLRDHVTGEEISGIEFPIAIIPRAGERVHYWQDNFPEPAGVDSGIRRDFLVMRVEHDWRYMPARSGGGSARYVPTVILHVLAQGDAELIPAGKRHGRPTHPGEVIAESLGAMGMTTEKAAAKLGIPQSYLKQVIKGESGVPVHLAKKIGHLFGNGAALWTRMQAAVDLWDAEHGDEG